MNIPEKIRTARKNAGLSQAKLSQLTGITQQYISWIERGKVVPSITHMEKIAKATGTKNYFLV